MTSFHIDTRMREVVPGWIIDKNLWRSKGAFIL